MGQVGSRKDLGWFVGKIEKGREGRGRVGEVRLRREWAFFHRLLSTCCSLRMWPISPMPGETETLSSDVNSDLFGRPAEPEGHHKDICSMERYREQTLPSACFSPMAQSSVISWICHHVCICISFVLYWSRLQCSFGPYTEMLVVDCMNIKC